MTFLPIVERELRIMARQTGTYRMRLGTAGVGFLLWIFLSIVGRSATVPQRASVIFMAVSILSLGFAMLAGTFLTADCLSEERREGTLGLLFLTDLKGHDVVLGKLVSTSVQAVFGWLAVLPILALPLLMGGMTGGEFWRTALVLLTTIFFSLSTAMLVSALSKDSRVAMLGSLLGMVFFAGVLPVLWWGQATVQRTPALDFLLWPGPGYAFQRALDAYYSQRSGPREFWVAITTILGLGFASLVGACVLLPRVWQETASPKAGRARNGGQASARFGSAEFQSARRGLLGERPFYWLATRDRLPKLWAAGWLGVLLPIWLFLYGGIWTASRGKADNFFAVAIYTSYGLHLIYKCQMAAEASRRLSDDRHSGALELLLATPLTTREIIRAQQDAVWDAFKWPRRLLVGVNLLLIWMLVGPNPLHMPGEPLRVFCLILLGGIVLLYLDTIALTRAGMWTALTTKRHTRAVLSTLRRVLLLPWLAVLLMFFFGAVQRSFGSGAIETFVAFWFALGIAVDVVVGTNAESQLQKHFRAAAAGVHARPVLAADGLLSSAGKLAEA